MFRLAGHLKMTVAEIKKSMSYKEFQEWFAFYELEPFGAEWLQTGSIAAAIYNNNANRKKSSKILNPDEFLPVKKVKAVVDPRKMKNIFLAQLLNSRTKVIDKR